MNHLPIAAAVVACKQPTTGSGIGTFTSSIVLTIVTATLLLLSRRIKQLSTLPKRSLSIVSFLLIWEIAVRAGLTYPAPIPAPSWVFQRLIDVVQLEWFWEHALTSISRVLSGYALALVVAIPLGVLVGWFEAVERFLDPLLQTMRQIPQFALYPAFILFFGIGELPKTLLIMLVAMWWILLNTITAVKNTDPTLVKVARSLDASRWDLLWKVVLPPAVPTIITGMRYASTEVVLALMTVEMMGAYKGLGILLETPQYWPVLLFMTILGVAANYALLVLERRFIRVQSPNCQRGII